MEPVLFFISGLLLMASEWQLEIIRIRASRGEQFSLPYFLRCDKSYREWSAVFLIGLALSFALIIVNYTFAESWIGIALFTIGFWQLSRVQFDTVDKKPYKPPMILELAREEIEMDIGTKKLDRGKHVSFWGDVWLLFIFAAYVVLLV
jgi:hypothetical protein